MSREAEVLDCSRFLVQFVGHVDHDPEPVAASAGQRAEPETFAAVLPDGTRYIDVNVDRRVVSTCWLWQRETRMLHAVDDATKAFPWSTPGITPSDVYQNTHEDIMPGIEPADRGRRSTESAIPPGGQQTRSSCWRVQSCERGEAPW